MEHDTSYKLLFSHIRMMVDLLPGFIHEDWVEALDLTTLERVNGSYVSDDLRDREDDVVLRARFKQLPDDMIAAVRQLEKRTTLHALMRQAATCETLETFHEALQRRIR